MLTISKVTNPDYYAEWLNADYYLNDKQLKGKWQGYLRHVLDLPVSVEQDAYNNLIQGKFPDGKKQFMQNNGRPHHGATDCCFSAPKSISLMMVTENRNAIIKAHENAVNSALRFLEKHAAFSRRGKNGFIHEKLPGLLFSKHTHFESRANQPQLHTHCLTFNLCIRNDDTTGTVSSRYLFKWKMAAGAIYRCQLANNMRNMGYEIRKDGNFFEVDGVSNNVINDYSKREQQIADSQKKLRLTGRANKIGDKLALNTRDAKSNISPSELFSSWEKELANIITPKRSLVNSTTKTEVYVLPSQAVRVLTERQSFFREQDLYQQLAIQGQNSFLNAQDISFIASRTLESNKVIPLGRNKNQDNCYTTEEVIHAENLLVEQVSELTKNTFFRSESLELDFEEGIKNAESELEFKLETEQLEAVKLVSNKEKISLIQGTAGTGKSTSFRAAKHVYATKGLSLIGASVSKKSADSLEESADISCFTVDMLIQRYQKNSNPLNNHSVLIVDEASQLSVFHLNLLIRMASESKTKLVLAGDIFQLQSISRPGAFNYLLKYSAASTASLSNIRRQNMEWAQEAVNQLKSGESKKAISTLSQNGLINFSEGHEETIQQLVSKYFELEIKQPNKNRLILARSWRDVKNINEVIRLKLKEDRKLEQDLITIDCTVSDKVFGQSFAIGDRVRLSKNDYREGLTNGTQGRILEVCKTGGDCIFKLALDDGRIKDISTSRYRSDEGFLPMVHAYASTIYSAQGLTVDGDSLVLTNSSFDRANAYVAGSRHKQNCYFFVDSLETDSELLELEKEVSDVNRLSIIADWFKKDNEPKLAIELLQQEKSLTRNIRHHL